ncbi:MAG: [FeFe] hydrogenase, group A [Desulfotomaculum sp.]|nr:[FeFe] hydrogenase, group A [Desulfotomaculum sp.]
MDKQKEPKKDVSRRNFLKMMGGLGLVGATTALTGCEHSKEPIIGDFNQPLVGDGWVPEQYQTAKNWPAQVRGRIPIHPKTVVLDRNDQKCILCGQCIEVCRDILSVFGYYKLPVIDDVVCIGCGQCIMWCPTKSLMEKNDIAGVQEALADPNKFVIVQTAPATRVALGEEFGMPAGSWVQGQQVAALKELGFDRVFDTNFSADLTIMEESKELYKILTGKYDKPLPLITSCCPAWVKFCEYFYPDLLDNISSAGSPMQMLGAIAKTHYAKKNNLDPEQIYTVAIMPCTAKKAEIKRPEMNASGRYWGKENIRDNDAVLTVRELANLIKTNGLDLNTLPEKDYDPVMGKSSGGGLIFGTTGGVLEACLRTGYYLFSNQDMPEHLLEFTPVRGLKSVKSASLDIPGLGTAHVAVLHGLSDARVVFDAVRRGESPYHAIEVMACPGGCIGGGGQPRTTLPPSNDMRKLRMNTLYKKDAAMNLRRPHRNPEIIDLYRNFLEKPLSPLAYQLLHPVDFKSRADHIQALDHRRKV